MGVLVVHGAQAGGFSPISVYGSIVNGVVADNGLPQNEVFLFFASLVVNVLIAAVGLRRLRRAKLLRHATGRSPAPRWTSAAGPRSPADRARSSTRGWPAPTPYQALTLPAWSRSSV